MRLNPYPEPDRTPPRFVWGALSTALLWSLIILLIAGLSSCGQVKEPEPPQLGRVQITGSNGLPQRQPYWNVWAEEFAPVAKNSSPEASLKTLSAGEPFTVVIDLSTFSYSDSIRSKPISKELHEILVRSKRAHLTIEVVAIPDEQHIRLKGGAEKVASLFIDMDRYRAIESAGLDQSLIPIGPASVASAIPGNIGASSPATDLSQSLARTTLSFETGQITGWGTIALSFWIDHRPVDELLLTLCVVRSTSDDSCNAKPKLTETAQGLLGRDLATAPAAALHLIDFGTQYLAGVFYCSVCEGSEKGYQTWRIPISSDRLADAIENQIIPVFTAASQSIDSPSRQAKSNQAFKVAGRSLYELIFRTEQGVERPTKAEQVFLSFVSKASNEKSNAPVLFVRMIAGDSRFINLPLNLMHLPVGGGRDDYLGFHVAVESYLRDEALEPVSQCINNWTLLIPDSGDQSLAPGRQSIEPLLTRFRGSPGGSTVFEAHDVDKFRDWLNDQQSEGPGRALVTLSHHYQDRLCFSSDLCEGTDSVIPADVNRRFSSPSLAILNGCGTAGIGATEFIESLAERGISTIIATSAKVDIEMAGQFLALLAEQVDKHRENSGYSISQARFDAVIRLSQLVRPGNTAPYGPGALNYTLVGNGQLRACLPTLPKERT